MHYTKFFIITLLSTMPLLLTAFPKKEALAKLDKTTREITHFINEKINNPDYEDLVVLNKVTQPYWLRMNTASSIMLSSSLFMSTCCILFLVKNESTRLKALGINTGITFGVVTLNRVWEGIADKMYVIRQTYNLPPKKPLTQKA